MPTSPYSSLKEPSKLKKIMLKVLHLRLLGWLATVLANSMNLLLFDQPARPSCTQPTPSGSQATETYRWNLTNGPMSSDGNSNIQLPLFAQESSFGKKDTLHTLLLRKLLSRLLTISNSIGESMKSCWQSPLRKVLKQSQRNLQVERKPQQSKLGFTKMVEQFRLPQVTTLVRTSPRCSKLSLKTKRIRKNLRTKQVGASQHDL